MSKHLCVRKSVILAVGHILNGVTDLPSLKKNITYFPHAFINTKQKHTSVFFTANSYAD